jgi:hypothetical protein
MLLTATPPAYNEDMVIVDNVISGVTSDGIIGAAADLDPGAGVSTFGGNGAQDAFVVKLDPNGDFVWGTFSRIAQGTCG